ncbi:unnamed protein product [Leptidea sinapis]|nr:unnamed protein product [Leptidea sinapis]
MALALQSGDRASERTCVRDAVLAATGVKTRTSSSWPRSVRILYSRISHLGPLHDKLKEFIDPSSGVMPQGLMGEGLVAAVCESDGGGGTLRRVSVWAQEPLHRLTWLANIAHAAQHKKASCVHRFVHHGDERVSALARRLLTSLL